MTHRLFVYGTLLRGEPNHELLRGSSFLGETATASGFRLLDCGSYPGMVRAAGAGSVCGELWEIDEDTLRRVDELEGHPDLFWRTRVRLVRGDAAWAYLLTGAGARDGRALGSDDWRARRGAP